MLHCTFLCNLNKCNTCSSISSLTTIQGSKQSFQLRQRFTSPNLISCIQCSWRGLFYTGKIKQRLGNDLLSTCNLSIMGILCSQLHADSIPLRVPTPTCPYLAFSTAQCKLDYPYSRSLFHPHLLPFSFRIHDGSIHYTTAIIFSTPTPSLNLVPSATLLMFPIINSLTCQMPASKNLCIPADRSPPPPPSRVLIFTPPAIWLSAAIY